MKIILTLLALASLVLVSYINVGLVLKIIVQVSSIIVVMLLTLLMEIRYKNEMKSLRWENLSLSADAAENRKNKERARKILGE